VLAIELICALQAVELRGAEKLSPLTQRLYQGARAVIPAITRDRVFAADIENAAAWLRDDWQDILVSDEPEPMVQMII
jgi:histidine ammonia-lyase